MDRDIITVALCLLGSSFFSASETALTSLPMTRLESLRTSTRSLTRAGLDRWAEAPQKFLITILVGNNLVNVVASALASRIAFRITGEGGLALAIGVMTLAILVFGEITPKTLAQNHAEWISLKVVPILFILDLVLTPVNTVLGLCTRLLSRSGRPELPVTEQDLLLMLQLAHRHSQLPPDVRYMIESVLRFQQTIAREIMVPRPQIITLDRSWSLEETLDAVVKAGHSRFPLVDGSPDNILGLIHAKTLLDHEPQRHWTGLAVPVLFIPETKALPDLLHELRTTGNHLAVVLDEFGGCAGIVTLEDAIELLVGEIKDEFDRDRTAEILSVDGGWSVAGHLSLRRLETILHRTLLHVEEVDSVGGLVASLNEEEVTVGTEILWEQLRIRVTEVHDNRPIRLLVEEDDEHVGDPNLEKNSKR
ncbi:MAG: hemolysin family protein [Thermoanaerobaculales bacterium]|nr:hemolysin family protein [Thermoanaerobaculales bacterium]